MRERQKGPKTNGLSVMTAPALPPEALFDLRLWAKARRFRTRMEESHFNEGQAEVRGDGREYVEVVCRRGLIYSFNSVELLAWTSTRGVLAELLAADPIVRVHQRGDLEAVVRFPVRLLDVVATVLRPRRRRLLDPDRARAIGRRTAFPGAQVRENALGRDGAATDAA